jgi:flavin reductase (DIM6/NTAB) family NADH-FMN oxidoreductase RutF
MKIEIGDKKPDNFKEVWEGQYNIFSHFESACGIPHTLFAITTLKENGKPNVCFHCWSSFSGDGKGYFAVLGGLMQHTHTYKNILRTGEFVVNFLNKNYFDSCCSTINNNNDDTDEFEAGGFTSEQSSALSCPRIAEAFLSLECKLEKTIDLSEGGITSLVIGRVINMAMQEEYSKGMDEKYEEEGFMFYTGAAKNLLTGEGNKSAVTVCRVVRTNAE